MKTKDKSSSIKAIIISLILCTAIVVGVIVFLTNQKSNPNTPPPNPPPVVNPPAETPNPTLQVPNSISVELLDMQTTFNYTVTNLGEYNVSIIIEDTTIATISDRKIIPNKIGSTKIITSINTSPQIVKETTLNIVNCVSEVNFYITDTNNITPERYFTNTTYILEIRQNILTNENPDLFYDNIKNINLIKKENNSYYFNFEIISYGDFSFEYKGKYVNLTKNYNAYKLPTNFDVNFSNNLLNNNEINLYLFNNNYITEANNNNIFNAINYQIIKQENVFDEFVITPSGSNIVEIKNNEIIAKNVGTESITIKSTISNVSKTYKITVSEISLNKIIVNNKEENLNSQNEIELNLNEEYNFTYLPYPIYSICNLKLEYNTQEIEYQNGKIKLIKDVSHSSILIKNNDNIIYTLTVKQKQSFYISLELTYPTTTTLQPTSNVNEYNLFINFSEYKTIAIKATTISSTSQPNDNTILYSYNLEFDENICTNLNPYQTGGGIALEFKENTNFKITIINTNLNIKAYINVIFEK